TRRLQRLANTRQRSVSLTTLREDNALEAVNHRLVRKLLRNRREPLVREVEIAAEQGRQRMTDASINISRPVSSPRRRCLFCARKISAHEVVPLEIAASSLGICPLRTFMSDAGVFQSPDVQANRRHAVM